MSTSKHPPSWSTPSFVGFLRQPWSQTIASRIFPQYQISSAEHTYRLDYAMLGEQQQVAIELDGFAFHSDRIAFTYDRLRQNDLHAKGWMLLRFSYDAIRQETARCVAQLQAACALDPLLSTYLLPHPIITLPEMDPDPLTALLPAPRRIPMLPATPEGYFDAHRHRLNLKRLV